MGDWDTFDDLKNRVMDGLADHTDTFFDGNAELGSAINEGVWEIYKILHSENRGFFFNTTPELITLTPSTNYYVLTNEFAWVDEIRPVNDSDRYIKFFWKDRHDQEFRNMLNYPTDQTYPNQDCYYYDVVGDKTLVIAPKAALTLDVNVFLVQDPDEMVNAGDTPPIKKLWRNLVVEYAIRKLKNKEETGEYLSHDKLLSFLLENLSKYAGPRGGTNPLTVEEYMP